MIMNLHRCNECKMEFAVSKGAEAKISTCCQSKNFHFICEIEVMNKYNFNKMLCDLENSIKKTWAYQDLEELEPLQKALDIKISRYKEWVEEV